MALLDPLTLSKHDEYFLAIGKSGIHSFLMLGVMINGEPKLLTRVGKTNEFSQAGFCRLLIDELGRGALAGLQYEPITSSRISEETVQYQAYSITYTQVLEFLDLLAEIDTQQMENPALIDAIEKDYQIKKSKRETSKEAHLDWYRLKSYVPIEENGDEVIFTFHTIQHFARQREKKERGDLIDSMQCLNASNTCRTTARRILETILGYVSDVSAYFFIAPRYKTTLKSYQLSVENFFILPPPPNTIPQGKTNNPTLRSLEKLYHQMQKIPDSYTKNKDTKEKFDAIKVLYNTMYREIMGEHRVTAAQLLVQINQFEAQHRTVLYKHRNWVSSFFPFATATEKAFTAIKQELSQAPST